MQAVASSSKAIGQTSNIVNHATHNDHATCQHFESNRGNQNLSQSSVRAHWASRMSHTDGGDVVLIDEDFDTDPGDSSSVVEGRGSCKRFRIFQSIQDVGNANYETEWPALQSTVHPGARPTIQSVVRLPSDKNVSSNRPSTTSTTAVTISVDALVFIIIGRSCSKVCQFHSHYRPGSFHRD